MLGGPPRSGAPRFSLGFIQFGEEGVSGRTTSAGVPPSREIWSRLTIDAKFPVRSMRTSIALRLKTTIPRRLGTGLLLRRANRIGGGAFQPPSQGRGGFILTKSKVRETQI